MGRLRNWLRRRTWAELLLISFANLILLGAILLTLPISAGRGRTDFVDALFTATSAVCVTGLAVNDIGTAFNSLGQAVILALIQLGGFGIVSFGTVMIFVFGRRASLMTRDALQESFPDLFGASLRKIALKAFLVMFAIEMIGAVLLFHGFRHFYPVKERAWQALFHSISAFCNAGFSLNFDNLIGSADNVFVNLVVMTLIVLGGIGFIVLLEMGEALRGKRKWRGLTLHSKLVLMMSAILIVAGAALIIGLENHNLFAGVSLKGKILRGLFQSVTARTCGYNTVEIGMMSEASLMVLIGLMFIGGAPGSCAGGVKVTSAGVLLGLALHLFRKGKYPSLFGRGIPREVIDRALILVISVFLLISLITLILLGTEGGLVSHQVAPGRFLEIVFEATSAFGTVGLSTGITPKLSTAGKLLITALMYIGRLGPLTLIYLLQNRGERVSIVYPEEEVMIG